MLQLLAAAAATVNSTAVATATAAAAFRYRKGLGRILESFDEARPRGDKTINSVKAIYKALHLDEIYARMREVDKGVSVFEVLVAHSFKSPDDSENEPAAAPAATAADVAGLEDKASVVHSPVLPAFVGLVAEYGEYGECGGGGSWLRLLRALR